VNAWKVWAAVTPYFSCLCSCTNLQASGGWRILLSDDISAASLFGQSRYEGSHASLILSQYPGIWTHLQASPSLLPSSQSFLHPQQWSTPYSPVPSLPVWLSYFAPANMHCYRCRRNMSDHRPWILRNLQETAAGYPPAQSILSVLSPQSPVPQLPLSTSGQGMLARSDAS